jgi:hypothetical protein
MLYTDVEATVGLYYGERHAPLRKDLRIFILCPQIQQTYGGCGVKEKKVVLLLIEPRSSNPAMLLTGLLQLERCG